MNLITYSPQNKKPKIPKIPLWVILLNLVLILSLFPNTYHAFKPLDIPIEYLIGILYPSSTIPFVFLLNVFAKKYNKKFFPLLKIKWSDIESIAIGLLLSQIAQFLPLLSSYQAKEYVSPPLIQSQSLHGFPYFLLCLSMVAVAPIFEEYFFRGFLMNSLKEYMRPSIAIVISAFFFAVAHFAFIAFPAFLAIGIVLGYFYNKTNNLLVSILIHSLVNGTVLLSMSLHL
jgi:membrane protease YdiL (CAAX protease family)